jgi:hypothetical protein
MCVRAGANANAVKELVICSLLLASRGIVEGHIHTTEKIYKEENVGGRCCAAAWDAQLALAPLSASSTAAWPPHLPSAIDSPASLVCAAAPHAHVTHPPTDGL